MDPEVFFSDLDLTLFNKRQDKDAFLQRGKVRLSIWDVDVTDLNEHSLRWLVNEIASETGKTADEVLDLYTEIGSYDDTSIYFYSFRDESDEEWSVRVRVAYQRLEKAVERAQRTNALKQQERNLRRVHELAELVLIGKATDEERVELMILLEKK
jgi:hypothetical protein